MTADRARGLRDNDGVTLAEAMTKAGRDPEHIGCWTRTWLTASASSSSCTSSRAVHWTSSTGPSPSRRAIWPHGRWEFTFYGEANHAGTTRLADRRDPMLAFASSVHAARASAAAHEAVATFGKVIGTPNGANAIPSSVHALAGRPGRRRGDAAALVDEITA